MDSAVIIDPSQLKSHMPGTGRCEILFASNLHWCLCWCCRLCPACLFKDVVWSVLSPVEHAQWDLEAEQASPSADAVESRLNYQQCFPCQFASHSQGIGNFGMLHL